MRDQKLSRRSFLKGLAVTGAATTASWLLGDAVLPVYASEGASSRGILVDLTRCVGCNSCALACQESNHLPRPDRIPDALAPDAYTFVDRRDVPTGDAKQRFVKRQCMHCVDAACVSACPAAAMHKSATGAVIYRADRCLGCRYCEAACPFGVPRFDWDDGLTPEINKCWLCDERLKAGQRPACVEACPTGALRFGRRDELLAQAHAQIASQPERYIDHVFGEFEVGGTLMLYISDVPFEQLGFPANLPETAPPEQTAKIISKIPFVIAGMTALMTGSAWYTHRQPAGDIDTTVGA